ncbi:MAG: hypothetical protein ACOH18_02880 [Candidatus Saccharimonadaceae bacterium]
MKRITLAALGVLAVFGIAAPAYASESPDIGGIVDALHGSSVYIAPGTEGTNSDTAAMLKGQMRDGDSIALVMLPSNQAISSESLQQITQKISDDLGGSIVVGISLGDNYDAIAPSLPAGIADELMRNADTVSQSSIDTMGTFVRNVHDWERLHPEQVSRPDDVALAGSSSSFIPESIGAGLISFLVTSIIIVVLRRRKTRIHEEVRFNAPRGISGSIRSLMEFRETIDSPELRRRSIKNLKNSRTNSLDDMSTALLDVCKYTEAYFSRLHPDNRLSSGVRETYEKHLLTIEQVTKRFIDMTLYPEYYDDAASSKLQGVESVQGFAEFVLNCIRQNNRTAMTDYTVGTKILSAQRYR